MDYFRVMINQHKRSERVSMKKLQDISLRDNDREAIKAALVVLKGQFPVEEVILFGSKARGSSDEHSDIDLLVITARPIQWREEKAIVEALFDLGMEYDVIFSPLFATHEEWDKGVFKRFPIYREIMEEGAVAS